MNKQFDLKFDNSWAWVETAININTGSDVTLLTVGDSFTWGDELGVSNGLSDNPVNDTEHRQAHVFGNILRQRLQANWVQHALPGAGNGWILDEADKLLTQLTPQCKKIIAVITLSEMGRELHNTNDPIKLIFNKYFKEGGSIGTSLEKVEQYYISKLQKLKTKFPQVTILCNYGFTEPVTGSDIFTSQTWIDVIMRQTNTQYNKLHLFQTGVWVINEYLQQTNLLTHAHKLETIELYESHNAYRAAMDSTGLYLKRYHPNETGHRMWADYLLEQL